jgi:peptidoglycan hydrolase-like protein with peptidoglycan-binding domain
MPLAPVRRTTSTAQLSSTGPLLERGALGPAVAEVQRLLQAAGVPTGPVDGDFGPMTQAAVRRFQQARGLAVDGVVGPQTWAALQVRRPSPPAARPVLRPGDLGADVERVQRQLLRHGFTPGDVDGQFGGQTQRALVAFQRAKGLSADGATGAATWQALEGPVTPRPVTRPVPAAGDVRSRLLDIARGELGTRESGGNNNGAVLKYPRAFGRGREAYCADFVSWVARRAGLSMNNPFCPSVVNELKRNGDWKGRANPQPGDLVLFDWDGDRVADHIGLVESVNADGSITTIEGNTDNPRTGEEGVWRRTRSLGTVLGFGNPY